MSVDGWWPSGHSQPYSVTFLLKLCCLLDTLRRVIGYFKDYCNIDAVPDWPSLYYALFTQTPRHPCPVPLCLLYPLVLHFGVECLVFVNWGPSKDRPK